MDPGQGRPRSEANAPDTATDVQETGGASPLTALLFDVCGVFYDDTGWRRWLFRLVTKMGIDTRYEAFFALFDQDYLSGSVETDTDYWEALRSYLGDIGLARGTIDEVLAAGRPRRRDWETSLRPLPGVRATLETLATRGVPLRAACSSAIPGRSLTHRLRQLRLDTLFDRSVTEDGDLALPQMGLFARHAEALGVAANEVGFVSGNVLARQHAAGTGLRVISIAATPQGVEGVQIGRFSELVSLVQETGRQRLAG
ncbi:MAG: hypothetical protein CMJ75_11365 [Planctomycetaceae bacterium]|nr:hypothetical protein [Planctomycetaceae bacterium]